MIAEMGKTAASKMLGIIHAGTWVAATGKRFSDEILPGVPILYVCDDTLQYDFMKAGPGNIPKSNFWRVATHARALQASGCDLVMVGCSTMSPSVEHAQPMVDVPMLQIDRPMYDRAVRIGGRVGLLATLDTTIPSSERLLRKAAAEAGKEIELVTVYCPEAFRLLLAGDTAAHDSMLLGEIDALARRVDVVTCAQLSMALLEDRVQSAPVPVLNSAREGFARAREMLEAL